MLVYFFESGALSLTLNLRDLKFFRFSKSVSIYREGCFEEFYLILLQKDQKQ